MKRPYNVYYTVQENVFGFLYGYEADFQGLFNRKSQNGNRKSYICYVNQGFGEENQP